MTRVLIIILFVFGLVFSSHASHLRGGEITYEQIGTNKTYRFTVNVCLDPDRNVVDDDVEITFGDGTSGTAPLINGPIGLGTGPNDYREAIYQITHTYTSFGDFEISCAFETRNASILNMSLPDEMSICLNTRLIINGDIRGFNNSVYFENGSCPEIACAGQPYCFNPLAVDPDGDSLVYSLSIPIGYNFNATKTCANIASYSMPNVIGGGSINIDSQTGTICWNTPGVAGNFVFVVKVEEYYKGFLVGHVFRDIQLTIDGSCLNDPPELEPIPDTCVMAGESFSIDVSATDPNGSVSLFASGLPFISSNPATFTSTIGNPALGTFSWSTTCADIPISPYNYIVTVEAEDNGLPSLSDYQSFHVRVIPPDIKNLTAALGGGKVVLNWDKIACTGALGYNIYRIGGTTSPVSDFCCLPGAATDLGYTLIAQVLDDNITTYEDYNVLVGGQYCYVVTAFFEGEAESCPIETACVEIEKDVPVITHVTVNETGDGLIGVDSIQWSNPTELDQGFYAGPYEYRVYFSSGNANPSTLIYTSPVEAVITDLDTTHVYVTNTETTTNTYRIEMFDVGINESIGFTNNANSVFLGSTPSDNQIALFWSEDVPWDNHSYEIYRSNDFGGPFSLIGTSTSSNYIDQGLVNGVEYCYYVKSIGSYPISSVINPIINFSQIKCDKPIDLTPPCPPVLSVDSDCIEGINDLIWNNPNNSCADDVTHYNIYYAPIEGEDLELIATINSGDDSNANDTTFTFDELLSVAGCYAVTALDSLQYNNESAFSNIVCVDNCPEYNLPNVFTPDKGNADGLNNIFHPIYPYRYIDHVEFRVFNRWGQELFYTQDPELGWNGFDKESALPVVDGTYYYICEVYALTLQGVVLYKNLNGHITVFNEK